MCVCGLAKLSERKREKGREREKVPSKRIPVFSRKAPNLQHPDVLSVCSCAMQHKTLIRAETRARHTEQAHHCGLLSRVVLGRAEEFFQTCWRCFFFSLFSIRSTEHSGVVECEQKASKRKRDDARSPLCLARHLVTSFSLVTMMMTNTLTLTFDDCCSRHRTHTVCTNVLHI